MSSELSTYADRLNQSDFVEINSDLTSSCVHLVQAPIPVELFNNLKSLAALHGRDARCIAGDILTIALREVFSTLPEERIREIEYARVEYDRQHMQKHLEETFFDAGGS